jgi:hypothetical protein
MDQDMGHARAYPGQQVDLTKITMVRSAFLERCGKVSKVSEYYRCDYENKTTTYKSVEDFVRFLGIRKPESIQVHIFAYTAQGTTSALMLSFEPYGATQSVDNMKEVAALDLCDLIESELGLEVTRRVIEPPTPKRSAFVAHSFDDVGEETAIFVSHLLELLDFKVVTGKSYSSKSISEKVKARVRRQGIVICILTKKWETTEGESMPAQWVIQEAAFTEGLGKPLFLFLEEGVRQDLGIHGDIEDIPFSAGNLTEPLLKLIEGLKELGYELSSE